MSAVDRATRVDDFTKTERWASLAIGAVCLASVVPLTYYVGNRRRDDIRSWVDGRELSWLAPDASTDPAEQLTAVTMGLSTAIVLAGAVVFGIVMLVRRTSARRLARQYAGASDAPGGRSLLLTAAGWTVLVGALAVGGTIYVAADEPNTSDIAAHFVERPAWIVLLVPGTLLGIVASDFFHRRRQGLRPITLAPKPGASARGARHQPAPSSTGFWKGRHAFIAAAVIDLGFAVVGLAEPLPAGEARNWSDWLAERVFGIVLAPAIIAATFLALLMIVRPTRRYALPALRERWTQVSLGVMVAGFAIAALGGVALVLGSIVFAAGGLLGSYTGLYIQDKGPQPFLGIVFILFVYGLAFHDGESMALPTTVVGWVSAAGTTVYALYQLVGQFNGTYGRSTEPARS